MVCIELASSDDPHSQTTLGLGTWQEVLGATASNPTYSSPPGVASTASRGRSWSFRTSRVVAPAVTFDFLHQSRIQIFPRYWGRASDNDA